MTAKTPPSATAPATERGATPRRIPENPFRKPTPENEDLSFLAVDDAVLFYAVEHHERLRRLREGIVFDHLGARDKSARAWKARVAAASQPFRAEPWMLPVSELRSPAVINGIFDYVPITETTPELYDREKRAVMSANGQSPWVIVMTLNGARHTGESFLGWVHAELIPRVMESAREITLHHFHEAEGEAGSHRRRIRAISPGDVAPAKNDLSEKRLRARLFALACHRIRLCAGEGEPMSRSFERYLAALPPGVDDPINAEVFAKRIRALAATGRDEWEAGIGGIRLGRALQNGSIHIP